MTGSLLLGAGARNALAIFESILWTVSTASFFYAIKCFKKASLLHFNLKLIMVNYCLALAIYGICRLAMNIDSEFKALGIGPANPSCRTSVLAPKIIITAAILVAVVSDTFLIAERTIATFMPTRYEQMKSVKVQIAFYSFLWLISTCGSVYVFATSQNASECNRDDPADSIFILSINPELFCIAMIVGVSAHVVNGSLLYSLYKHNKKRRNQQNRWELSIRYQYVENIVTTRLLIYLTGLGFSLGIFATFLVLFYLIAKRAQVMNDNDLFVVEQCFHALAAIYGISYSTICLTLHRPNREQLLRDVRLLRCFQGHVFVEEIVNPKIKSVEGNCLSFKDEGLVYFKNLSQQWEATAPKRYISFQGGLEKLNVEDGSITPSGTYLELILNFSVLFLFPTEPEGRNPLSELHDWIRLLESFIAENVMIASLTAFKIVSAPSSFVITSTMVFPNPIQWRV
uniref:G_PROTEIN_RECEP_F1_2 domain-containing protein n=1 Tax=Steinernema glaseri TaxID=37863 RepID=A0A1I8AEK5_9BILA